MIKLILTSSLMLVSIEALGYEVIASWYGNESGTHTANGERFDPGGLTAAHRSYPFGTKLLIEYKKKTLWVRINDRGPHAKGRSLDLARGAARRVGLEGVGRVNILKIIRP